MKPETQRLVFALVAAAGLVAMAWFVLRNRRAADIAADVVETWHENAMARNKAKLDALSRDAEMNKDRIIQLKKNLNVSRDKLRKNYESRGLSAQEIAERFERLG